MNWISPAIPLPKRWTGRGLPAMLAALTFLAAPAHSVVVEADDSFQVGPYTFSTVPCAADGQVCTFSGNRRIAYGTGQTWVVGSGLDGSVLCSAQSFGSDPAWGEAKACYVGVTLTSTQADAARVTAAQLAAVPPTPDPAPLSSAQKQAARLLNQATWGATGSTIAALAGTALETWVDTQLAMPLSLPSHYDYVVAGGPLGTSKYINAAMETFWSQAVTGQDQLRQRMTLALDEIFVVSTVNSPISVHEQAHASYLDTLARNAFGNYRQLLEDVARHPAMGLYLSHLRNQKEDPAIGRLPDENFAREVMQLFSIGLWELNPDGSRKLDASGQPIATYTQEEIMGMAKVFTGWSWGGADTSRNRWEGWLGRTWNLPMQNYPSYTSSSEKRIVGGVVIPAGTDGPTSLRIALDTLAGHPNVGPFLGQQLIKRFVTSNPSPAYIARISAVWEDDGQGVRGNLAAVIRAILLDEEARGEEGLASASFGKLREPMLRFGHWLRAFDVKPLNGVWTIWNLEDTVSSLGQNPMRAPSVFNWFRPDFAPPGAILDAGLTAPEFQITHETTLTGYGNFMFASAEYGVSNRKIVPDYTTWMAIADNPRALLSRLDLELCAGQMGAATREAISRVVAAIPLTQADGRRKRVWQAVALTLLSPDYLVQR